MKVTQDSFLSSQRLAPRLRVVSAHLMVRVGAVLQRLALMIMRPDDLWYGYHWWQKTFEIEGMTINAVFSWGWGGQYVFIFPDFEMVVVSNAGNFGYRSERFIFRLIEKYILPAVLQ